MYLNIDLKDNNRLAIVEDTGATCTYGELIEFTKELSKEMNARDLVFILCKNSIGAMAAHIACIENKVVPLMISEKMDFEMIENLIELYAPQYLWATNDMTEKLTEKKELKIQYKKYGFNLIQTGYETYKLNENLAMLLTTSGSTGSPKLVRHSYKNLFENAKNVANFFAFSEEDNAWIDLQLHYTMGLNVACSNLYAGATLYMTSYTTMDTEYWNFYNKSNITNMTGVPYNYEMLKKLKFFKKEHPSLKIMAEGGGRLTNEMFAFCANYALDNHIKFFATFGTSETTARLAYLDPERALEKIGSIGKAIPNGRLYLKDDEGNEIIETEAVGELAYTGPNVTMGYAIRKEDLELGDERHGEYCTGDIAKRDSEGFYYIIGRKARFLKLYSYRVSLDECERMINQEFNIQCACAGNDEQMKIYTTDERLNADIRKFISDKTKIQINAFRVLTIDHIPRNEVGKILYKNLEG